MEYFVLFFCFAITLHNIEETIWLPEWSKGASKFHKAVKSNEFYFAIIVITSLAYLSSFYYLIFPQSDIVKWVFTGFLGSMIFNAIFPHLLLTIIMRKYALGLATGILLNIPINSFIIQYMLANDMFSIKELIISTVVVGAVLLSFIPVLFKIGDRISPISKL
ncbi:HXXEE domain-containing protein [Metabacillus fastidiosus]|uniref:HXXEE domain-containing protein n=1 Tax=Metabacillus fastidiosus TaxID=1458 RepID=A0ABU6NYV3_9BACI|nr:HXXEE domain-containing protein [Metabacillus fastidiosus]MED4402291.1 HXXEE domain-containing protein [Metabacillus fastidiosus]MED4462162.1 HXXEE domain-containing protein [Metabacillus fastidiosus]